MALAPPAPAPAARALPLKGWAGEAAAWLTAAGADPDQHEELYRQAQALPASAYLAAQARVLGATGTDTGMRLLRSGHVAVTRNARHRVRLAGFDWLHPKVHDRSQLWVLQQWLPVRDCLYERNQGAGSETLDQLLPWVRDWVRANVAVESFRLHQHLAWHDHATALRAIFAVYLLLALAEGGHDLRAAFPGLYEFVGVHMVVLRSEAFYSKRTNHGFDQAFALYLLASAFDLGDLSEECRRVARERLEDEMGVAFSDEGVHIENSPAYQWLMLNRMLQARDLLRGFGDDAEHLDVDKVYNGGVEFLVHAIRPNGTLPAFGDSDNQVQRCDARDSVAPVMATHLRYNISQGQDGTAPLHTIRIFPRSGYAFLRNRWSVPFDEMLHLAVKSGFLSTYHRHDDDNTFTLFAYGEDWLLESGIFKYHERDPMRLYLRSSLAHNIVTPRGVPVSRTVPPPGSGNGFRQWRTALGVTTLAMRSLMFEGLIYDRELRFDRRTETIDLWDRVSDAEKAPRDYEFRLHFPADKKLSVTPGGALRVLSPKTRRCLIVQPQSSATFEGVEVVSERQEEPMAGWTSPAVGEVLPAQTAIFHQRQRTGFDSRVQLRFEAR